MFLCVMLRAQVAELQATSARLARDKASLTAELTTLRDELGCCCCGAGASTSRSPVASPLGTPGMAAASPSFLLLLLPYRAVDVWSLHKRTVRRYALLYVHTMFLCKRSCCGCALSCCSAPVWGRATARRNQDNYPKAHSGSVKFFVLC